MPKLIIYHQGKKSVHEFGEGEFAIGRSPENNFVSAGQKCSRNHCKLVVEGDAVKVVDLDSRNGTHVNGQRVKEQGLSPGDAVKAGDVVVFLETEEGSKSGMAKCPNCFNMVVKAAKKCEYCGVNMDDDLGFVPRCRTCQKEQEHDGEFCVHCGAALKTGKAADCCVHCHQVLLERPELCPECGLSPYPPSEEEVAAGELASAKEVKKRKGAQVAVALACAAAGYALAYFLQVPVKPQAKPAKSVSEPAERQSSDADVQQDASPGSPPPAAEQPQPQALTPSPGPAEAAQSTPPPEAKHAEPKAPVPAPVADPKQTKPKAQQPATKATSPSAPQRDAAKPADSRAKQAAPK